MLVKKHNIIIKRFLVPKPLHFANRLLSSFITHYFIAIITIGHYIESMLFYVMTLSPFTLVILGILWFKKHNLKLDFPTLRLKFNSNYCAYNYLLWHIYDCDQIALYGHIIRPMLKYCQPIMEKVPNTSELIYIINKAKILEDWTTALSLRK